MAPLLYIPITDPFAVLGIILLFALIITSLTLLIFTARRSAQDARQAVYDQSRYQRLMQLQRREGQRSFSIIGEGMRTWKGKGREKVTSGPAIMVTMPSISSLRSKGRTDAAPTTGQGHTATFYGNSEESLDISNTTASTKLLDAGTAASRTQLVVERLPRPLRVGRQNKKFQHRSGYEELREASPAEVVAEEAA